MKLGLTLPPVLHALFDIPLFALRSGLAATPVASVLIPAFNLIVGFGTIAFAAQLARRLAAHQIPGPSRFGGGAAWRGVWALIVVGAAVGFLGATLLVSALRQAWRVGRLPDAPLLVFDLGLIIFATSIFYWGRLRLRRETPKLHL